MEVRKNPRGSGDVDQVMPTPPADLEIGADRELVVTVTVEQIDHEAWDDHTGGAHPLRIPP